MRERATVALARCAEYDPVQVREAIQALLEPFGGIGGLVRPGERILLKPNFVTKAPAGSPACTHPEVILAVACMVREAGAHPVIGDSPALGSARGVAKNIGLLERTEAEGFPVIPLKRFEHRTVELNGVVCRLTCSAEALEFDGILNLPKFKAHRQATLTFGIKNLYGCVPGKRKAFRHFASNGDLEWFSNMLIANVKILNPRFTLVDGIVGMEGQGPVRGTARKLNVILGGTDVVAVDSTCCRIVGYSPIHLCTLKAARRMGFGVWDPSRIDLAGDPVEDFVVSDFKFAREIPIFFSLPWLAKSYLRSLRERMAPE